MTDDPKRKESDLLGENQELPSHPDLSRAVSRMNTGLCISTPVTQTSHDINTFDTSCGRHSGFGTVYKIDAVSCCFDVGYEAIELVPALSRPKSVTIACESEISEALDDERKGLMESAAAWYAISTEAVFAAGQSSRVSIVCRSLVIIFQFDFID